MLAGSLALTVAAAGAAVGLVPYRGGEGPAEGSTERDTIEAEDIADDPVVTPTPSEAAAPPSAQPDSSRDETAGRPEHGDPATSPQHSGHGRRVVYDMSDQRVWLVGANGSVRRSYLVSGSVYDNLRPGSYRVYSRSRHAVSFDQQSTMDYMVRFTEGDNASIGFHDIPEDTHGDPVQSVDQLGTPRSHGCIRQRPADAKAMWDFAGIDTTVRVLA
jgi:lipoprotein-anchoring transpeptidase ErfK/SrfK